MSNTGVNAVTIPVAVNTAASGTLSARYEFISVLNETGVEIWVCTNGNAATVDGDFCTAIPVGGNPVVLANMLPTWDQSSTVIPFGSVNQWGQSKAGGVANPGVSVSVITAAAVTLGTTPTVTVQGAG